jgi:hypothetical protein
VVVERGVGRGEESDHGHGLSCTPADQQPPTDPVGGCGRIRGVVTRVAVGRARVVREVRAAAPLMAALRVPVTAQGPWLTAVLNEGAARGSRARPAAVVVEAHAHGRPEGVSFLSLRRSVHRDGLRTVVTTLGDGCAPLPPGRPAARLLARDEETAARLAAGVHDLLLSLRGPWTLRLAGLPLGDPTQREIAARLPGSLVATERSSRLVDELDDVAAVLRTRDPRALDRELPGLLEREPDPRARGFLRSTARLHAAIGGVELAMVPGDDGPRAALLTLVEGADRWPWWGFSDLGGLRTELGSPLVSLTARARDRR